MLIVKIVLGLFGLGIVVFFHELGHFLAARLVGIHVEAFSIGWGNPILKKKIGDVEYRLGMFPVGGYCKMKGETDYNEAWENMRNGVKPEKGSYLAASPAARILVSFAGPFFNVVLAVLILSFIWGVGFETTTLPNKIVLSSEIDGGYNPADIAGIKTGDIIKEINGKKIYNYTELRESIIVNPDKNLLITVERNGFEYNLNVTPSLDKSTGAGRIGIYPWIDPVIGNIENNSAAQRAGLLPGDRIISVNENPVYNSEEFEKLITQEQESYVVKYERPGYRNEVTLTPSDIENGFGFYWEILESRTPSLSIPAAVAKGTQESIKTLAVSIKSLGLLFKGIDLTQAVSGPVRITYMMGDFAAQGFGQNFGAGLHIFFNFIAIISIALGIMNMLPLPILDGGMIILFAVEWIRGKPISPKVISVFQTCGMVIIFGLMIFALFGDIMFFTRQ